MSDLYGGTTSRTPFASDILTAEKLKEMLLECQKMAVPKDWIVIEPSGVAHKGALGDILRFVAVRHFAEQMAFRPFAPPAHRPWEEQP